MSVTAQLADGRILEFPDGTDPSVVQATVKKVIAGAASPLPTSKPANMPSTGIAGNLIGAVSEPIVQAATGTGAAALGGLAGIAGTILPGPRGQGAAWSNKVGNALTYEPRTAGGKAVSAIPQYLGKKVAQGANWIGEKATDAATHLGASPEVAGAVGATANTAVQAAPAIAAKMLGGKLASGTQAMRDDLALRQSQNALFDQNLQLAKSVGYRIPPNLTTPERIGVAGVGGKAKIMDLASVKNQPLSNALARQDLGLPAGGPITPGALSLRRTQAYQDVLNMINHDYGSAPVVKQPPFSSDWNTIPEVTTRKLGIVRTPEYKAAIGKILDDYTQHDKSLPSVKNAPINAVIKDALKTEYTPQEALHFIQRLRARATEDFTAARNASGKQPGLLDSGRAKIAVANAMEDLIEQNLEKAGATDLLQKFRNARATIAKTYNVEKALNWSTGDVSVPKLVAQFDKGAPLSGNLEKMARIGKQYPQIVQNIERKNLSYWSPWDMAFSVGAAASGHPLAAISELVGRGVVAPVVLSKTYQDAFVKPQSYTPSSVRGIATGMTKPELSPFYFPHPQNQQ